MNLAYGLYLFNLSAAGSEVLRQSIGYIQVVRFQDANGVVKLDGEIKVQTGAPSAPSLPLLYNGKVVLPERTDFTRFEWSAQADTYALVLTAPAPNVFFGDFPNPKQVVTSALGATVAAAAVTVGTSAVALAAASSGRHSVTVQNLGGADIYVGPSGVTTSSGLKIEANGGAVTLDKQTAAIYGISGSAGNDVRVLTESA
jgi:hypothetical protein